MPTVNDGGAAEVEEVALDDDDWEELLTCRIYGGLNVYASLCIGDLRNWYFKASGGPATCRLLQNGQVWMCRCVADRFSGCCVFEKGM